MTRELHPHHLAEHSSSASSLWRRELEMRGNNVVTEQSTLHPPEDPVPAMTSCYLTVKELTEQGGRDEGCLALPPSALASEYVFFWSRCFVEACSGQVCGKQQQQQLLSVASQRT